jgi:RND family efflux transporter MFP subunit
MYAKVSGYVRKVNKDIDDRVEEGDALAELSAPELDADLRQKRAAVTEANASADQARQALAAAGAASDAAAANLEHWQSEYKRVQGLFESKSLNEQQLDEAKYEAKAAEAARAESLAKQAKAAADLRAALSHIRSVEAERGRAEALADYEIIRAPFKGVVTRRTVDPGRLLPPATSGEGAPLFVVAMTDPVRLFIDVPEADAVLAVKGMPASVRVSSLGGATFTGTVARTAWALDPKTRTLRTEIDLPNADGRLRPGMYCYATITATHENVWTLPVSAVAMQNDKPFAYRVEDGKAVRTLLRTGFRDDKVVEVVGKLPKPPAAGEKEAWEDVTENDEFVKDGVASLTDGQAVTIDSGK